MEDDQSLSPSLLHALIKTVFSVTVEAIVYASAFLPFCYNATQTQA